MCGNLDIKRLSHCRKEASWFNCSTISYLSEIQNSFKSIPLKVEGRPFHVTLAFSVQTHLVMLVSNSRVD